MTKYLIHSCEKRKWYVDQYLVPSMVEQGIDRDNILVYNDAAKQGNLKSFIKSADLVKDASYGTWHLQDDIIISSSFKEFTEEYDNGLVCGFCNTYSSEMPIGICLTRNMWYSFPCIRIPNYILKDFINWIATAEIQNKYKAYIEANKFDDTLFRFFMMAKYPNMIVHNLCPNIVDNVDYLLGGSLINYRKKDCNVNSLYFAEPELIEELSGKLHKTNLQN